MLLNDQQKETALYYKVLKIFIICSSSNKVLKKQKMMRKRNIVFFMFFKQIGQLQLIIELNSKQCRTCRKGKLEMIYLKQQIQKSFNQKRLKKNLRNIFRSINQQRSWRTSNFWSSIKLSTGKWWRTWKKKLDLCNCCKNIWIASKKNYAKRQIAQSAPIEKTTDKGFCKKCICETSTRRNDTKSQKNKVSETYYWISIFQTSIHKIRSLSFFNGCIGNIFPKLTDLKYSEILYKTNDKNNLSFVSSVKKRGTTESVFEPSKEVDWNRKKI